MFVIHLTNKGFVSKIHKEHQQKNFKKENSRKMSKGKKTTGISQKRKHRWPKTCEEMLCFEEMRIKTSVRSYYAPGLGNLNLCWNE